MLGNHHLKRCHSSNDMCNFIQSLFIVLTFSSTQTDFNWPSPLLGGNLSNVRLLLCLCLSILFVKSLLKALTIVKYPILYMYIHAYRLAIQEKLQEVRHAPSKRLVIIIVFIQCSLCSEVMQKLVQLTYIFNKSCFLTIIPV